MRHKSPPTATRQTLEEAPCRVGRPLNALDDRRRDDVAGERLILDNHSGGPVGHIDARVHAPIVGASQPSRRSSLDIGELVRADAEAARERADARRDACPVWEEIWPGCRQIGVRPFEVVHAAGIQSRGGSVGPGGVDVELEVDAVRPDARGPRAATGYRPTSSPPIEPLAVMVNVWPTCPAPVAVD